MLLRSYISLTIPFLLVLISIRIVMSPLFLQFEYNLPDFPEDVYGFSREDRLRYAPYAIAYLLNDADIAFLGDLRFPDGKEMYNARELHHMRDVKTVTQYAYRIAVMVGLSVIIVGITLWRAKEKRSWLRQALWSGSILTLGLIAAIVIMAVLNWDFFFTSFHNLFFASGTWRFEYSDTLIRLFPEQFWFDAALTIGSMTFIGAITIIFIAWFSPKPE